jgi:hypothetical protein
VNEALRALLEQIVDYAGLFPPAALDVPTAARNYASYRSSPDRWMLGRFVVGSAQVVELRDEVERLHPADAPWPISVVAADAGQARAALDIPSDTLLAVESVEVRIHAADVDELARRAGNRELYVEVPLDSTLESRLDAIASSGARAKIRTGGTTPEAFPQATDVLRFLRGCAERNLSFKATAGLHHPLRGVYRLTYEPAAISGTMFGFLNIFLAALLVRQGIGDGEALALLTETGASALRLEDDALVWRDRRITAAAIRAGRMRFATSFGSCSFREPVDELPWQPASVA